jgi:hypothetical protein
MNYSARNIIFSVTTALITLSSGAPALADDTELFVGDASAQAGAYPNLLFILDNSGSMGAQPSGSSGTAESYDPLVTYPGACDASRTYYLTGGGGGGRAPDLDDDIPF